MVVGGTLDVFNIMTSLLLFLLFSRYINKYNVSTNYFLASSTSVDESGVVSFARERDRLSSTATGWDAGQEALV